MEMFKKYEYENFCNINDFILDKSTICNIEYRIFQKYKNDWCSRMESYGQGCKLRTYALFKSSFCTESYLKQNLPLRHRSAFAKFRCGVAPSKIETGRYEKRSK